MTYSTLMVHLDVGSSNVDLLRVAADLAEQFRANVIGIGACQPMQVLSGADYIPGELIDEDYAERGKEMVEAEASFRVALHGKGRGLAWRSSASFVEPADYIAREGRAADLLVTGPDKGWSAFDTTRRMNVAEVVLRIGRPVLIVGRGVPKPDLRTIAVGWKETREARRAIADALPFLRAAGSVTVVEIVADQDMESAREHLADVVEWLGRHDVAATSLAVPSFGDDAAQLDAILADMGAGLLVAGAYGHSRFREWVLGGVTRDLLLRSSRCTLLSH